MGLTGKYDFPGFKKAGTAALSAVLAGTAWGAWILASPLKPVFNLATGLISNWLTNKGLLIVNLGAIYVEGEFDQNRFDKAMNDALDK